ncbi:Ig-like domain repeat protein [Terriglobus sp.]|uniref:NHL domain-containing protein n=1 Tax=Terriglobus sp. TaxID=1889013 RepID=UPI003B0028A1
MRLLHLSLALPILALLLPFLRAQDAVLVLLPAPVISIRAGTGSSGFRGEGTAATTAQVGNPSAMAKDSQGNLFLADTRNHRIRRISPDGIISTIAGTGAQGFAGDEGPATQAQLDSPSGLAVTADGTLYIADTHNHRLRRIDSGGVIHTVAGTGKAGFSGDGTSAVAAQLDTPLGLAAGLTGDLYIADSANHRVRHISANGTVATVAGDGTQGRSPDGTQATAAHLDTPVALTVRSDGSVLIADRGSNCIFILQSDGTLHTFNTASVALRRPSGITLNSFGDTLIADSGNYRVAQISSSGAGSALGSGVQGVLDRTVAPAETPMGAPVSLLDTSSSGTSAQFAAIDRDSNQIVQVSLPHLTFSDTVIATASLPRSLLLRNAGSAALLVTSITVPASFAASTTSTCGTAPFQLTAGASCNLSLTFTPQTDGVATGMLQVDIQNAPPQRVTVTGTGLRTGTQLTSSTSLQTTGTVNYAGTPLTLAASVIGGSAIAATGTVTFLDGTTELGSGTLNPSAQAALTTGTLAAGNHTLSARYNGDVRYLGSSSAGTAVTVATPPDFTVAAVSSRVVLHSGSAGSLSLMLQPVSGVLNQTVTVAVDGLPAGSTVNVTPVPVTIASDPVPVNIAFKLPVTLSSRNHRELWLACIAPLFLVFSRKANIKTLLATALATLPLLMQGCGGGYLSSNSVAAQSAGSTYAVTVTAACPGVTGATLTHSATFTVVVQP